MDPTEDARRALVGLVNASAGSRDELEARYGRVWDTEELQADFTVTGFAAPFVLARNKKTGETGSLMFQARPRFYWGWDER